MKILGLRFKNLNALRGQWSIDFTDPAYEAEGLFAITGPTGAGKTTLLDAICLALYGQTPRLGPITSSHNEIMSRHEGACFAEVVFATQAGRFCCHWSQHRAYRKPEGALQTAKHELSNVDTGALIAESLKEVEREVIALTGLSYQQFTRSMLLAQGGFAAFLQAGADERAPLLEQITGTEIYAQISIKVHEQRQIAEKLWREQQANFDRIELLDASAEQALQVALDAEKKQRNVFHQQLQHTRDAIQWHNELQELQQGLRALEQKEQMLKEQRAAFAPHAEQLKWAQKALLFESEYSQLQAHQQQLAQDQQQQGVLAEQGPALAAQLQQAQAREEAARQAIQAHQNSLETLAPLWQQVEGLDHQLQVQAQERALIKADVNQRAQKLEQLSQEQTRIQQALGALKEQLQSIQQYQQKHSSHAQLATHIEGLELLIEGGVQQQQEVQVLAKEQAQWRTQLDGLIQTQTQQKEAQVEAYQKTQRLLKEEKALQRTLAEQLKGLSLGQLRAQVQTTTEQVHMRQIIASLEKRRAQLKEGEPCPLCGALSHPYVEEEIPSLDEYELRLRALQKQLGAAEHSQEALDRKRKALELQQQSEQHITQQLTTLAVQINALTVQGDERTVRITRIQQALEENNHRLTKRLHPLGISLSSAQDMSHLKHRLREWLSQWQHYEAQGQQLLAEQQTLIVALQGIEREYATRLEEQQRVQTRLATLTAAYKQTQAQRTELLGTQCPTQARAHWQEQLSTLEGALRHAEQDRQKCAQQQAVQHNELTHLKTRIAARSEQLAVQTTAFVAHIQTQGFVDWEAFVAARLSAHQRAQLEQQAHQLEQAEIQLAATQKERTQRMEQLLSRTLTEQSMAELEAQHQRQQESYAQSQEKVVELSHQIKLNEQAKQQHQEQQEAVKKQQKEYERWQNLHQLIGSADGKKFRNFAQSLSFAQLVYYANQQMQTMSDRYALLQDRHEPLHLNVIDNYQGGVVRSTQNLSGGESFIVSLALALGLSKMASQNVRIDSLFLDEGFGTLDDEALAMALDTLANLRQESKLIGVISHVPALKERISTQIEVQTNKTGWSTLHGPGCVQEH